MIYTQDWAVVVPMANEAPDFDAFIGVLLRVLNEGNECAFGSRFCNGGSMADSPFKRRLLFRTGTFLSNWLLGTKINDATSGFQEFHCDIIGELLKYTLRSKAHFYQTEIRYLMRNHRFAEVPIHYRAPSNSVSKNAIRNARETLLYYFKEADNAGSEALRPSEGLEG